MAQNGAEWRNLLIMERTASNVDAPEATTNGQDHVSNCNQQTVNPPVKGFVDVTEEHKEEYLRNWKTHQTGISHEEMIKSYNEWADTYDQDILVPELYNGHRILANAMVHYYTSESDRANIQVLDVAAGTGIVGCELNKNGFKCIDALEPSHEMLQVLNRRGIYRQTFESLIGYGPVDGVERNTCDSLVIAGGMGEGHVPVSALEEMIHILKPGGTVFILMREEYLTDVKEYVGKLEPRMLGLQEQGRWNQVHR